MRRHRISAQSGPNHFKLHKNTNTEEYSNFIFDMLHEIHPYTFVLKGSNQNNCIKAALFFDRKISPSESSGLFKMMNCLELPIHRFQKGCGQWNIHTVSTKILKKCNLRKLQ